MVRKETLLSANISVVIQHSCENSMAVEQLNGVTAQLWSSTAVKQQGCEEARG